MMLEFNLDTAKTILQMLGTIATAALVLRGIARDLLPPEFGDYVLSIIKNLLGNFSNEMTLVIDEFDGLVNNEVYEAAEVYLGSKVSPNTKRLKISKPQKEKHYKMAMEKGQQIIDTFHGEKFKWIWVCTKTDAVNFYNPRDMNSTLKAEVRSFELTFHSKSKDMAINSYLPYIMNEARIKKQEKRTIKLYTADYENLVYNSSETWQAVTLNHPATFDTLAMDDDEKKMISDNLDRFLGRKDYYKKIGKAWKRGYLLYGPPGTGKSSLIAAIANKLNFDVYDLELSELRRNSDLRKLLLATENKSILIVEDIDCTIDFDDKLANRENSAPKDHDDEGSKVTLSGLLNFADGLWSNCGNERIIIFTTNHIEKLDPALLRPGRMDVHIHMSYCTFSGFKTLAYNYLNEIKDHVLFEEIEDLFRIAKVTPAEVAEQLLRNDDVDVTLRGLIDFMRKKIEENDEKSKSESIIDEKKKGQKEDDHNKENGEIEGSNIIN